jgi:SulP family sulfate permease
LDGVSILDAGGVSALNKLISHCEKNQSQLILTNLQPQPLKTLVKAHTEEIKGVFCMFASIENACEHINDVITQ